MLGAAVVLPLVPIAVGPPCMLRTITGIPCPLCGTTRAVTAAVHGDLLGSLWFNPAGLLVVVTAVVVLAAWRVRRITIPIWTFSLVLALMWAYQLFKFTTGRPL